MPDAYSFTLENKEFTFDRMKTALTSAPLEASKCINEGGIVAFPTETVYGLGADIFNEMAIGKVFLAKERPADNPLIAHVGSLDQIATLSKRIERNAEILIEAFFPGALTIVVSKAKDIPNIATAGLSTIGIRMPDHELALEFLRGCENPVVAPSANLSGKPSPTNWRAVLEDLDGRIDCILQGEATKLGLESTVVDCTGEIPLVLRPGAVSVEELRSVIPEIGIYNAGFGEAEKTPRSPGLRHTHYSPKAKVILISIKEPIPVLSETNSAFIGINDPLFTPSLVKVCDDIDEYAREIFEFFRECDRKAIDTIYCENVSESGIGIALMDRLERAAE